MKDVVWSGELELHQIDSQAGIPETMLHPHMCRREEGARRARKKGV